MDRSRSIGQPSEQFLLTELQVVESYLGVGESTANEERRRRCIENARRVLDTLYRFLGQSTDPHVMGTLREQLATLEQRLGRLRARVG